MKLKWLGHSCFKIKASNGIRVLTDPFDDNVGYKIPSVETDIITVSHGHYDHNFTDCVKGNFEILNKVGNFNIKDVPIMGIHTYHDDQEGALRGGNIVYVFDIDGMRICHLGDLGHTLTIAQINMIGKVDVLFIPVGGIYTIDAEKATEVLASLKPSIAIAMHYMTSSLKFKLDTVDKFLELTNGQKLNEHMMDIKKEMLNSGETKTYALSYK